MNKDMIRLKIDSVFSKIYWSISWRLLGRCYSPTMKMFKIRDEAVFDLLEFLEIDITEFQKLAEKWQEYVSDLFEKYDHKEFYLAWIGDVGKSNLAANLNNQFLQFYVVNILEGLASQNFSLLDFGCGTAVITFGFRDQFGEIDLVDLPNMVKDFILWRIQKNNCDNVKWFEVGSQPNRKYDIVYCFDVLEHLENPSEVFLKSIHNKIKHNGYLLIRAPWGGHPEHLPEAPIDWYLNGGSAVLKKKYKRLLRFDSLPTSGLFKKLRN